MALDNPAFSRNSAFSQQGAVAAAQDVSAQQLQSMYDRPATLPDREVMTVENTIAKTAASFGVLVVFAAVGWTITPAAPWVFWVASLVGFVLALVNIFKKEPSPALILAYAAAQGVFLGGISLMFESQWSGIVAQAVIGTLAVVGVTLALFASGKIRASKRADKFDKLWAGDTSAYDGDDSAADSAIDREIRPRSPERSDRAKGADGADGRTGLL